MHILHLKSLFFLISWNKIRYLFFYFGLQNGFFFPLFRNLYPKFASPWASSPCRPQDIGRKIYLFIPFKNVFVTENQLIRLFSFYYPDFHVPSEYLTNIHIRDKVSIVHYSTRSAWICLFSDVVFQFRQHSIFEIISRASGYAFVCPFHYIWQFYFFFCL